jgi:hypothetical protein
MIKMIFKRKGLAEYSLLAAFLVIILLSSFPSASALNQETISRRDLVIDLGDGLTTDAQLTFPAVGDGPFPGVLLIHGSGNTDMDEYLPPEISDTENGSRPFLQIAEYLSERGFAVLRYNKRGVGLKGVILDVNIVVNTTFEYLLQDAEKALETLIQQPEVNATDVSILGHSEGTWIAPRIAIKDTRINKIVLMSAGAHNLYDILHFQLVEQRISEFEEIDGNNDGLLSIQEASVLPPIMRDSFIENSTGDWMWKTGVDPNGDGYISLVDEMLPLWNQIFEYLTTAEYPGSKWYQSHFALENNLEIIGNVSAGILILQGEEDTQTPVFEAHFLDQRLMEVGHHDHTLITYPGLGHSFYPKEGLLQWLGPIQDHVLSDLATWLKDPERDRFLLVEQLQTASNTINELQGQLNDLKSEFNQQTSELENQVSELQSESTGMHNTVTELKSQNMELQSALDSAKNMTYIALGAALIAVIFGAVIMFQNRNRS